MKTVQTKAADIKKKWVVVDAEGQSLGRLASQVAHVLRGKHKPSFVPYWDCGDYVIVTNAAKVEADRAKKRAEEILPPHGLRGRYQRNLR